ncbi:MAG: hypothetical protein JNL39_17295 [Opitutaceae bacterium]|nr:hypothetical protein [Opitutaceae bacterium]
MQPHTALTLLLCLAATGTAGESFDLGKFTREATELILYSIVPAQLMEMDEHGNPTAAEKRKEKLHGYPVLGKIAATTPAIKAAMRDALLSALQPELRAPEAPNMCFQPRHAICLKQGSQHVDVLLCFECGNAKVRYLKPWADKSWSQEEALIDISDKGLDALNRLLDARGIQRDLPKSKAPPKR